MHTPHFNVASASFIFIIALAYNFKLFASGYILRVSKPSVILILFLLIWYDVSNGAPNEHVKYIILLNFMHISIFL